MIARFHILLPYQLEVPANLDVEPIRISADGYNIVIYPPYQTIAKSEDASGTSPVPALEVIDNLFPNLEPIIHETVQIDERPVVSVNAIIVDFIKPELNRNRNDEGEPDETEPPTEMVFGIINSFLSTLRVIAQIKIIKPIESNRVYWRMDYMTDDGLFFSEEEGKIRAKFVTGFEWITHSIIEPVWEKTKEVFPDYRINHWDQLILDAHKVLPEVGASIVLANTALETFIKAALDGLATENDYPEVLWNWLYDRNPLLKNPSTDEQFDVLLKLFTGSSLKDNDELWEAYKNIKKIRNGFVHEGILKLGDVPVDKYLAGRLINKAKRIIEWVEQFLSADLIRPKAERYAEVQFTKIIQAGDGDIQTPS